MTVKLSPSRLRKSIHEVANRGLADASDAVCTVATAVPEQCETIVIASHGVVEVVARVVLAHVVHERLVVVMLTFEGHGGTSQGGGGKR
jgi:hypothetical protein